MEVINRKTAVLKGLVRFYTGKSCKNGHDAERYTSTGACVVCAAMHSTEYRKEINRLLKLAKELNKTDGRIHESEFRG
ncbi:hypothetical protein [Morganella morganii]|uniref:hypothetical protein n=1 Tax=Morganella morganii TaxID=582 RepID=UPI0034E5C425